MGYESEAENNSLTAVSGSLFLGAASCAISSCNLLAPGCVNPFTGLESDVSIETTPDLALSLLKTNEDGFQYTACLSCSNGVETKTIDDFVMTQCKKLDGAIEDVALAF